MEIVPVDVEGYEYTAFFIPELDINAPGGCFVTFPQFQEDFEILWKNEIITIDKKKIKFRWNYSLTSLGEYFRDLKRCHSYFLEAVEFDFDIKRHTLKHLINANGREPSFIREKSIDYEKLIKILEPHRKEKQKSGIFNSAF